MADFVPITTQEQFDNAISARIQRERAKYEGFEELKAKAAQFDELQKKAAGFESSITDLNAKLTEAQNAKVTADNTIAEQSAKIKAYETNSVKMRIAHELGLPYELASRLSGEDEGSVRKDAEALQKVLGAYNTAPLAQSEKPTDTNTSAAYKSVLAQMRGE